MSTRVHSNMGQRRGAALAMVLVILLLLSISGFTAIQMGHTARVRAVRQDADIAARYAADAGLERALHQMNQSLASGHWQSYNLPSFMAEPLAGANAVYTVDCSGSLATGYEITSVGRSNEAERTVRATAKLINPFALNYAILAKDTISLKNKSSVEGFNSGDLTQKGLTADIGTLSEKNGSIDIKNGATVNGDIYVGPSGNPEKIVSMKKRSDVKGELFNLPIPAPLPKIKAPSMFSRGKLSGKNFILSALDSGKYSSIEISNNGQLLVVGSCVMEVTGNISLNNGAEIKITPTGSLTIYLAGNLDAKNSSGVVNDAAIPSKFKLYGTGTAQTFELKNSAALYGVVYAPNASMTLHNGGKAYGSFIVNDFELKNSGDVYYDKALMETSVHDEGARFVVTRREEL